jgi:hypothetical protein
MQVLQQPGLNSSARGFNSASLTLHASLYITTAAGSLPLLLLLLLLLLMVFVIWQATSLLGGPYGNQPSYVVGYDPAGKQAGPKHVHHRCVPHGGWDSF